MPQVACVITRVVLTVTVLPDEVFAQTVAVAGRSGCTTSVHFDARSTRRQTVEWVVDNLTEDEQNVLRAAYGLAPHGQPAADWTTEDTGCFLFVPKVLRHPGRPALQGGWVLRQRHRAGTLTQEIAAYRAELSNRRVSSVMEPPRPRRAVV